MAELTLPRQLRATGQRAIAEARARRAGSVEAEHVLLAILARPAEPAAELLANVGLDYATLTTALDAERARSLGAAGISPPTTASLATTPRIASPGWGASVRDALRTADKPAAKSGQPGALEIELVDAILGAELGTVPRALGLVGLDRGTLRVALHTHQVLRS
jgi:ATP-dependent Clp protease ATP-binding subunit ClpA